MIQRYARNTRPAQPPGRPFDYAQDGFTLIELMIVLAVAAVLLTLAAPSFRDLILDNRRTAAINGLIASLQDARIESVKRGLRAVLCKSTNGATCSTSGSVDWRTGWLIYVDTNANGTLDAGEEIIRIEGAISGDSTATFKGNANVADTVIYKPSGEVSLVGTITYCDTRGDSKARAVIVASNGRPRASSTTSDGSALTCP